MSKAGYAKTPTVFQMESAECGAASLSMILRYFGKHVPLEKMRIECGVSRDGSNAGNILRAAKRYGLEAHGYRKDLEGLLKLPVPCIIHWNFNHFVVWEGTKGQYCYINDPAEGRRRLLIDDIDACFTGVVIIFKKGPDFVPSGNRDRFSSYIFRNLAGQKEPIAALILTGIFLIIPGLLIPVFSQVFIDGILVERNYNWFAGLLAVMIFTMLFRSILTWYRGILLLRLQNKLTLTSAHRFLTHFFRLPISFFAQRYAGDLSQRMDNNIDVHVFLTSEVAETVLNIFSALFYLVLLCIYSPMLTAVGLLIVAVNLSLMWLGSRSIRDMSLKLEQDEGRMNGNLFAGIAMSDSLKATGTESEYAGRLHGFYAKCIDIEQRLGKKQEALNAIPEVSGEITTVVIMIMGGLLVINGKITEGMLVAFNGLLTSFLEPINALAGFTTKLQKAKADARRVEDIMRYEESPVFCDNGSNSLKNKLQGNVSVNGVSFGYSSLAEPLIVDFGFELSCGSSVAIVGESGSGKSTVSKLISGLYRPWSGEIRFDGILQDSIPGEVISGSVSIVSQDITFFAGNIRDNLTMWSEYISEEDMIRAAKDACIHDVITSRPGDYDCRVTENGENFSGGQRQRLEIARALATNPSIIILDEATSALDPVVEKQIMDNIKRRGCTCIIVAHRLSTIRDCNEILVMDKGRIVERGTHEELLKMDGHYKRLIQNA